MPSTSKRLECGCSSGVEHNLAKVRVEGSNPFARSNIFPSQRVDDKGAFGRLFVFRREVLKQREGAGSNLVPFNWLFNLRFRSKNATPPPLRGRKQALSFGVWKVR